MWKKLLSFFLGLVGIVFAPPVLAEDFTSSAAVLSPILIHVKAGRFFNPTGIYASPGRSFSIVAGGVVDISTLNGGYQTQPDGTIRLTPPANLGAFEFFRDRAGPLNTDPVIGSRKAFLQLTSSLPGHLPGAPYGALVAGFSPKALPSSFADFPNGFALVGASGIAHAPNTGGYLFLGVNDFNNPGGDNAGAFQVGIFPLRNVPFR